VIYLLFGTLGKKDAKKSGGTFLFSCNGMDVLLSLASHVLNRRIIISNFDRPTSTDLRRHVMGPESARNLPPIYL
jgi:hypothetical protein